MEKLTDFKKIFWDAFHRPKLETDRYMDLWMKLEPLNDRLAGPFYNIYTNGNCDYIFTDPQRFPGINDADDFLDYCTGYIHQYRQEIAALFPEGETEKKDRQVLLYQVDMKMELANLAYHILQERLSNLPDRE